MEKQLQQPSVKDVCVHAAIHYVVHASEFTPVSLLAKKFNTSSRTLERKFNELAGFSPKLLSRIVRFQSAIKEYVNKQQSLTDIAHRCGYYDQSHFIHDFKLFSGYSPKQYFSAKKNRVEWWDVE